MFKNPRTKTARNSVITATTQNVSFLINKRKTNAKEISTGGGRPPKTQAAFGEVATPEGAAVFGVPLVKMKMELNFFGVN